MPSAKGHLVKQRLGEAWDFERRTMSLKNYHILHLDPHQTAKRIPPPCGAKSRKSTATQRQRTEKHSPNIRALLSSTNLIHAYEAIMPYSTTIMENDEGDTS
ncbi:hypothetical protein TIFTF001_031008 [Ficus carica]|uniref:Uncharacterized protein n=1 Tax=Ficus carica TaxID=3494 RepID=A0AA88J0G1_FICCA|nr:hypothetical protein TIFTF001_031008 [Ficus carica]